MPHKQGRCQSIVHLPPLAVIVDRRLADDAPRSR
jgi:hypothetical protein